MAVKGRNSISKLTGLFKGTQIEHLNVEEKITT